MLRCLACPCGPVMRPGLHAHPGQMSNLRGRNIRTWLVAHRGDHETAPENTLAAFSRAVSAGARWLECDIQFTRDDVPVVLHDAHLGRLCGIDREIGSCTLSTLAGLSVSGPEGRDEPVARQPIPLLADFLRWLDVQPGVSLFLEIKPDSLDRLSPADIVRLLLPMIGASRTAVIPISGAAMILEEIRTHAALPVGWVAGGEVPNMTPDYVFIEGCDSTAIRHWHARGVKVAVYVVNDTAGARACRAAGADLVETNCFASLAGELDAG